MDDLIERRALKIVILLEEYLEAPWNQYLIRVQPRSTVLLKENQMSGLYVSACNESYKIICEDEQSLSYLLQELLQSVHSLPNRDR